VEKNDKIAIISGNRPEWIYSDLAALSVGAVVVPLYPTSATKEISHILEHSGAVVLFAELMKDVERIKSDFCGFESFKKVVCFEPVRTSNPRLVFFPELMRGAEMTPEEKNEIEESIKAIQPDDIASIIYTSGTTGVSKGVMLSHRNFLTNCYDAQAALPLDENDVSLSFLPFSHVFERMAGYYLAILCGFVTAFAENLETVQHNLLEVKPTIARAVPRFFEKIYININTKIKQRHPLLQSIFRWALDVGRKAYDYRLTKKPLPFFLNLQSYLVDRLFFSKIHKALGGRMRFMISGGAPLAKGLAEFFYSVGVLVLEGYGLTETSPVISVNRPKAFKFGSVGKPVDHVAVKIAGDGEVLVRGESVMRGYFRDDKATKDTIRDGWLYTGDLGMLDADGFLYITGRKKDIIVTSGGKNISPQKIENIVLEKSGIAQIVLIGDKRKYLTALIVPSFPEMKRELLCEGIPPDAAPKTLIQDIRIHQFIRKRLDDCTRELGSHEKIKYFTLLARELALEQGEMTPTFKIKRQVVGERYRETIDRMYGEELDDERRDRIFFIL